MDNESAPPDPLKVSPPVQTRDPLIRYSVFVALGCAGVCMIFTILYIFSYSLDSTLSFERHFDAYLAPANAANLPTVLGLHMAQNRMFLQSCGMVAGIFFAFLGIALFLVGIQGTVDATGEVKDYSTNFRRLAPGGVILLASMIFVGVSAMHPIDFVLGPSAAPSLAPSAATEPAAPADSAPTQAPSAAPTSPTQSRTQPAPVPQQPARATPAPARAVPQSAQVPAPQLPAILLPPPTSQPVTATGTPAQTTTAAATPPKRRLVRVTQKAPTPPPTEEHRFQP